MKKLYFLMFVFSVTPLVSPVYAQYLVVNKANPIEKISKYELRNIFLGNQTSWGNGTRILVSDYNFTYSLRKSFSDIYLETSPQKVSMVWIKVSLSGKALPPKIFRNENDLKSFIAENEGAVGYVTGIANLPENVKVVLIL